VLLVLIPLGLGTKWYHGPGETWVHESAGDVLNGAFWLFLVLLIGPRIPVGWTGFWVFCYCAAVEFSQLLHTPALDALRRTLAGRLLLGTEFDLADIGWGGVGVGMAAALATSLRRSDHREKRGSL
jgi:hypothetical protein